MELKNISQNNIDILINSILIKKHNLDNNKIKFIKESQTILNDIAK